MNLRTITIGVPAAALLQAEQLEVQLQQFLDAARSAFSAREIAVRTFRINLPFAAAEGAAFNQQRLLGSVEALAELCRRLDVRWFNVPFDLLQGSDAVKEELVSAALEILKRFPRAFVNLLIATGNRIDMDAITRASRFIKDASRLDNSGYPNFRVGVSCNCRANAPFFPFTNSSEELGFSIGLELTPEFIKAAATPHHDLLAVREAILQSVTPQLQEIDRIALHLSSQQGIAYHGIDVSLAPFPDHGSSVAQLIERLGLEQQGSNGTLFVTSYLTDILKALAARSGIRTVGFNGVMFSLLEDDMMGRRNTSDLYSIDSLISYAAVCGCGLDMVPLPGDIFEEELASIILDVAALSTVLGKPLGVRVLPIPMKRENEFTAFNMDFLFNTRIKKVKNLSFLPPQRGREPFFFLRDQRGAVK